MRLAYPLLDDFCWLARNMRPDEKEQFAAFAGMDYDPDTAARVLSATRGDSWALVGDDGVPVAVGGLEPVSAGTVQAWAMGTLEGWAAHWHAITRASRKLIARSGARRVQVMALASRTRAHHWYEKGLGMQREGVLRAYASGQDVVMFARVP